MLKFFKGGVSVKLYSKPEIAFIQLIPEERFADNNSMGGKKHQNCAAAQNNNDCQLGTAWSGGNSVP